MSRRSRRRARMRKQPSQRKPDAARRLSPSQRHHAPDLGTPEIQLHRRHAAGFTLDLDKPFDEVLPMEFPLEVMRSRGLISVQLRDAGMRFGALAWSLYGEPFAGCEAIYERMVSSIDRGPRIEPDGGDRQKRRADLHAMMVTALQRYDPALNQPIESGRMRRVVVNVCQYCHTPRWLIATVEGLRYRLSDGIERGLLMEGLRRIADLERQQTPRRAA